MRFLCLAKNVLTSRIGLTSLQARLLSQRLSATHVIFDFDGLLVDTERCYTIANQTMLRKYGREYTPEHNAMIIGRSEQEAFTLLLKAVGLEDKLTPKEYIKQYDVILEDMFLKCKAMPGAEKLVRHLHKKNIPMALCSGSRGETFGPRREPHKEWLDLIPLKVFVGDEPSIKRGKPHPDPFLATVKRFPVKPLDFSKVIVFEDSPNGARAALAAGMNCVMVPADQYRKEALSLGVTQVLRSLEEFCPEEYGIPPFD